MPFSDPTSAFWFHGRLHPSSRIPPFGVEEVPVDDGVRLEVIWDGIAVWSKAGSAAFKEPGQATELFQLVVGAYALLAREVFDVSLGGWVEATEAEFAGSVVGFLVDRARSPTDVDAESEESKGMKAAAELAIAVRDRASYRLALRDIHASLRNRESDDAFLFAYRAVEDVARERTEADAEIGSSGWADFHQSLGLTAQAGRNRMEPLTRARRAAAHGDTQSEDLNWARRNRDSLIDEARCLVIGAFATDQHLGTASYPVRVRSHSW